MPNINLNLIPESYAAKYRKAELLRVSKNMLAFATVYLIIVGITLLSARYVLQREFTRIVNETTLVTAENRKTETAVRQLNAQIDSAQKLLERQPAWSPFLVRLSSHIPPGIRLTDISVNAKGDSVIEGISPNRLSLQQLKSNLEKAPGLKKVDLPLATLLTPGETTFTIHFTVDLKATN
jgi:Tfp pilus assembly protein PilN